MGLASLDKLKKEKGNVNQQESEANEVQELQQEPDLNVEVDLNENQEQSFFNQEQPAEETFIPQMQQIEEPQQQEPSLNSGFGNQYQEQPQQDFNQFQQPQQDFSQEQNFNQFQQYQDYSQPQQYQSSNYGGAEEVKSALLTLAIKNILNNLRDNFESKTFLKDKQIEIIESYNSPNSSKGLLSILITEVLNAEYKDVYYGDVTKLVLEHLLTEIQ